MFRSIAAVFSLSFLVYANDIRLTEAAKNQDRAAVQVLLKQHADVNASQGDGTTALHWAAHWDDLEIADLLLRGGARVNATTDLGITPLALACERGNAPMVARLLASSANPNLVASTGISPLMSCARSGNAEAVKALLMRGAKVNAKENTQDQTALMWAVSQQHPDAVKVLLEHGADTHARTRVGALLVNRGELRFGLSATEEVQTGGNTALLFAARVGDLESAKLLIAAGADVNDTAAEGTSALVVAAHSGRGAVAAFLLEKGANPNASGAGYAALHIAALRGDAELVKALLRHGANPNALLEKGTMQRRAGPDFFLPVSLIGATPFLVAAKYGSADVMRTLAAGGGNTQLVLKDGLTPLIAAAAPDKPGDHGQDAPVPYDEKHALDAVRAALDFGCDVNAAGPAGDTALHVAASRGYTSVIQLLADHGAKLDAKNTRGQTPLLAALASSRRGGEEGSSRAKPAADLLRNLESHQ